jgi:hypothetical protein
LYALKARGQVVKGVTPSTVPSSCMVFGAVHLVSKQTRGNETMNTCFGRNIKRSKGWRRGAAASVELRRCEPAMAILPK